MTNLVHLASIAVQLHGADLHPFIRENARELVVAFAMVESSGRNLPAYQDGKEQAFGLFAMHLPRWNEHSKLGDWGTATPPRQVEVMLRALSRYCHCADKFKTRDYLRFCCAAHNGFGSQAQRHRYHQKIVKAWPKLAFEHEAKVKTAR